MSALRIASGALAIAFAATAVFHVAAAIVPDLGEPSPLWRHALFVAINGAFAAGFAIGARRGSMPRWFAVLTGVLVLQQAYSHGFDLWRAGREGRVDLQSVLVLATLPVIALVAARLARDAQ